MFRKFDLNDKVDAPKGAAVSVIMAWPLTAQFDADCCSLFQSDLRQRIYVSKLPPPIPSLSHYDLKIIDLALESLSGFEGSLLPSNGFGVLKPKRADISIQQDGRQR